jgi:hypothetical protein
MVARAVKWPNGGCSSVCRMTRADTPLSLAMNR